MAILDEVKKIVAKQLDQDPSTLDETTNLAEAGYESLDVIETIFELEDKFGINIPFNAKQADAANLQTIADIVKLVESIQASRKPE